MYRFLGKLLSGSSIALLSVKRARKMFLTLGDKKVLNGKGLGVL